jgi:hypothetical protein
MASLPAQEPGALRIAVIEGENAIHNIRGSNLIDLRIRIQDEKGAGLPDVPVTFTLPTAGAGGTFLDGSRTLTVVTDGRGEALAKGFRPNESEGRFPVRISAVYKGVTARRMVMQTNAAPVKKKPSGKTFIWVALIAGAAVVASVLINAGKSGDSSNARETPFGTGR